MGIEQFGRNFEGQQGGRGLMDAFEEVEGPLVLNAGLQPAAVAYVVRREK